MSKLPKAPLQEAIFELRWPLKPDPTGRQLIDPEYQFALGKFQDALKNKFPFHVLKFPNEIPIHLLNYQTIHQFWSGERKWPVVQIGPGIATINETEKNYEWEKTYLPNITETINALKKSYGEMAFNQLTLRYIDVVKRSDYREDSLENFVQGNFQFKFQNEFNTRGKLTRINFEQEFEINNLGFLNVSLTSSQNDQKEETFIWQTAIVFQGNIKMEDIPDWLSKAHDCTSNLFKEICKKDFYASFN